MREQSEQLNFNADFAEYDRKTKALRSKRQKRNRVARAKSIRTEKRTSINPFP